VGADCPTTDQRGLPRPQRSGCDIGAFEASVTLSCPADLTIIGLADPVFYNSTVPTFGGTFPYTWSLVQGSLPDGLTLNQQNGSITGYATTIDTSGFWIKAVDSSGNANAASTISCSIMVTNPPTTTCPDLSGSAAAVQEVA